MPLAISNYILYDLQEGQIVRSLTKGTKAHRGTICKVLLLEVNDISGDLQELLCPEAKTTKSSYRGNSNKAYMLGPCMGQNLVALTEANIPTIEEHSSR